MRRITKAALGGLAGCAVILGGTQAANSEPPVTYNYSGDLVDLQLATPGPFDDASATLRIMQTSDDGTGFKLRVEGIDPSTVGTEFGAHLHVGPCVEGNGSAAGPHYNAGGGISDETEVWFELVPNDNGVATSNTLVPFVPDDSNLKDVTGTPGIMSIVIHVDHTDHETGLAGARQACLPLDVPQWDQTPETG